MKPFKDQYGGNQKRMHRNHDAQRKVHGQQSALRNPRKNIAGHGCNYGKHRQRYQADENTVNKAPADPGSLPRLRVV